MADPGPNAPAYFGGMVDTYDSLIRRALPRYDEMISRLVNYLPASANNILELGCGTGNLTLQLLKKYPTAKLTVVDAAPEMTEITVTRARHDQRLRPITARFEDLSRHLSANRFDIITSSMSLHHVPDKAPLYANIHNWLTPNGAFMFADQLLATTPAIQKIHWDLWLAFCRQPGHCTEEEIASLEAHAAAHDHYVPLPDHFKMLAAAGFTDLDCVWRTGMYSIVSSRAAP